MDQNIKIKGRAIKKELDIATSEYIEEAISDFSLTKYFTTISNNHNCHPTFAKNGLFIYHGPKNAPRANVTSRVLIEIKKDIDTSCCFDYLDAGMVAHDLATEDVIRFINKGRYSQFLGSFYKTSKSLILCDLTHTFEGTKVVGQIINYLKDEGLLTEVKKSKEAAVKRATVSLGADPEFEYLSCGEVSTSFPDEVREEDEYEGAIGVDGAGDQIEFRPDPADNPEGLVANVRDLMTRMKKHRLSAVGNVYPLGAHIHFGIGQEWHPDGNLIKLLDDFFGRRVIDLSGEARSGYKQLGAYRSQPHGFEYRVPPSAIFENPNFLQVCLKICQNIVEGYINGDTFEYNLTPKGVVTYDEYKRYCNLTEAEYEYFENFINNWTQDYSRNLVAFWVKGAKPEKENLEVKVNFRDYWNKEIKELVQTAFNPIKGYVKVDLFGLKEDRGNEVTSGFQFENFKNMNPNNVEKNGMKVNLVYGLPYAFRKGAFSRRVTRQIIREMVDDAKNKIKGDM